MLYIGLFGELFGIDIFGENLMQLNHLIIRPQSKEILRQKEINSFKKYCLYRKNEIDIYNMYNSQFIDDVYCQIKAIYG